MLISKNLHNKSNEVSIKTASLSFIGQVTKHIKDTIYFSAAYIQEKSILGRASHVDSMKDT